MFALRFSTVEKFACAIAMVAALGTGVNAQEGSDPIEEEEVIEEIVVFGGGRPDDPVDLDALYEEMMLDMLQMDFDRLQELGDDLEWRKETDKTINTNSSSRIKWGYDPQDELRMRREMDMSDVQGTPTKPATVFRVEF
jgi:hypothetical protein